MSSGNSWQSSQKPFGRASDDRADSGLVVAYAQVRLPFPRARPYLLRQLRRIEAAARAEGIPVHVRCVRCIGFESRPTAEELIRRGRVRTLLAWRFGNLLGVPGLWPDVWRVAVEAGVEVRLMGEEMLIPGREAAGAVPYCKWRDERAR